MNASGVGKTFGSLAVETLLNPRKGAQDDQNDPTRFYMPLYIGFNSGFSLTTPETDLLKDKSVDAYDRVCGVVGRRLLYQLRALDSTEGILSEVLKDETHWLAKTPQPADDETFATDCQFPRIGDSDKDVFIRECVSLLGKLAGRCGARKLSVLLIIDEGQLLDHHVKAVDNLSGGARFALHFCRRLQLLLEEAGRASLLPIMTGINPVTTLPDGTTGKNLIFSEPLLKFTDYHAVLKTENEGINKKKRGLLPFKPDKVHRIASLLYPVIRVAINFVRREPTSVRIPDVITPLWLVATCASYRLQKKYWDPQVPAIFDKDNIEFVPKLSLAQFVKMLRFTFLATSVHFVLQKMKTEFSDVEEVLRIWQPNGFEEYSFYVLSILFAMANVAPVEVNFSDYNGITAMQYDICMEDIKKKSRWLQNSFKKVAFLFVLDSGAAKCFLPTCYAVTHDEAFKLKADGTCEHEMHKDLGPSIMESLKDSGDCLALWCGGNAPVDFIWIIRKSAKDADPTDPIEVEICLAHAKHKDDSTKVFPLVSAGTDMPTKFLMVANYLEAALRDECGMKVVEERFAVITSAKSTNKKACIITNRAAHEAGKNNLDAISNKKEFGGTHVYANFETSVRDAKNVKLCEEVSVLTRDTFNIPPLSELLFGPEGME